MSTKVTKLVEKIQMNMFTMFTSLKKYISYENFCILYKNSGNLAIFAVFTLAGNSKFEVAITSVPKSKKRSKGTKEEGSQKQKRLKLPKRQCPILFSFLKPMWNLISIFDRSRICSRIFLTYSTNCFLTAKIFAYL